MGNLSAYWPTDLFMLSFIIFDDIIIDCRLGNSPPYSKVTKMESLLTEQDSPPHGRIAGQHQYS